MPNVLKNLRDIFFRPPLLKWKHKPRLLSPSEREKLIKVFVRGATWGIAVIFLAIFILYLFAPSVSLPLGKIILYSLLVSSIFYFIVRYTEESIAQKNYQVDDRGITPSYSNHYRFLWKGAIGYSLSNDEIFLVGKGGKPYHLLLPSEPERSQLLAIIKSRLTSLSSNQIAIYSVPIIFTGIEVIFFTVFAFCNAILVWNFLLPLVFQSVYSNFEEAFVKFLLFWALPFCLPTSVLAIIHTQNKYPQFEFFLESILIGTLFFTYLLVHVFFPFFLFKELGWLK